MQIPTLQKAPPRLAGTGANRLVTRVQQGLLGLVLLLSSFAAQALTGTYTINKNAAASSTNYVSFATAMAALSGSTNSGNVVFDVVAGSGPYLEQVIIPAHTPGAFTTTINGNGNTLSFATTSTNMWVLTFATGTSKVTVDNLVVTNTATSTTTVGGISLLGTASNNTVSNCTVTLPLTATGTTSSCIAVTGSATSPTTGGTGGNNTISGNTVTGGYYTLIAYGTAAGVTAGTCVNNRFLNNMVRESYAYSCYALQQTGVQFIGNDISRPTRTTYTTSYGLYITTNCTGAKAEKNKLHNMFDGDPSSTSSFYGMYSVVSGTAAAPNDFVNNVLYNLNGAGTQYLAYLGSSSYVRFYNNTMVSDDATGGANTTYGVYQTGAAANSEVYNNNIVVTRGGTGTKYAYYNSSTTTPNAASDYNNLYVSGNNASVGYYSSTARTDLAAWQSASSKDANSKSVDPLFVSSTDYHPTAAALNNVGNPNIAGPGKRVTDDQAGVTRSATPDIGAYEFAPAANDVQVLALTAPAAPTTSGPKTVTVQLQNNGLSNLTSVTVQYTLNGGTAVSQAFTGLNIAPMATGTVSFTTQATLNSGANAFVVTATLPNGSADPTPTNNTLNATVYTLLSGAYTINNLAAVSSTNFQSFTAAAAALNNGGVSGAVTFTVSNGPYTEQIELGEIAGVSNTNRVVFNGGGRTIRFGSTNTNQRAVIKFNGADYVTINNLLIDATNGSSSTVPTYGWGIHFMNASNNNTINGCTVTTVPNDTGSEYAGIVASNSNTAGTTAGDNVTDLTLSGNTIINGYYGIVVAGVTSTRSTGLTISNNILRDVALYSIYLSNQDASSVVGNDISRPTRSTTSTFYGIYMGTAGRNNRIERNRIHDGFTAATTSTSATYGIYFSSVDAIPGESNQVVNNLLYNFNTNANATVYALYNLGSDYVQYYHNTVVLDNQNSTSTSAAYAFYQSTAADGIELKNNIFYVTQTGTGNRAPLFFNTSTSNITSDYNDLYVSGTGTNFFTGGYNGVTYATLADWQTAGGPGAPAAGIYDQNSVQVDPSFVGATLVPSTAVLNSAGDATVLAVVPKDFTNGANRTSPPDIGAYEFTPPSADVALTAFVSPMPPVGAGSSTVAVSVQNNGGTTLTSLRLVYTLNGGTAVTQNFTGLSIGSGSTGTVTFSAANNVTLITGNNTLTVTASLPNGATDATPADNVISESFRTSLAAGTYTINSGAPTTALTGAGTNFQTFVDVATALNEGGIAGSVIFNVVAGSGPYNEQFIVGEVAGTSSTSTITINGNGRVLTSGATTASTTTLGVLNLNGTDWVTINSLGVTSTATATSAGIRLTNGADNNTINSCTITMDATATVSTIAGIAASGGTTVVAVGNAASNLTLSNNLIRGGYYGITVTGPSATARNTGLTVSGNQVRDFYAYGLDINFYDNPQIIGNDISRPTRTNSTTAYGIALSGLLSADVERNRVHDTFTGAPALTSAFYGIYSTANDATSGSENDVVNNLLYNFNGNGVEYGIYNVGSDFARYYHNTIVLDNANATTASTTRGFYQTTAADGIEFVNNIVSVTRAGSGAKYALYFGTTTSTITSNNNDLHIGSGSTFNTGYYGAAFVLLNGTGGWKTANGGAYDQNSVQADPLFAAPGSGNLQPSASAVNNTGDAYVLTRTPTDYNGVTRNTSTPDPGAYEFTPSPTDLALVALVAPASGQSCYSTAETVTVTVRNVGTTTLNFATTPAAIAVAISGTSTVVLTGSLNTGTLAPGATQNYTLTQTADLNAPATYTFTASASVSGDGNPSNNVLTPAPSITSVAPSAGTLSPGTATTCYSSGQLLTLTGAANGTIQFQSSTNASTGFTDITGATSATYTTVPTTQTMYYRAQVRCGANVATSNVATVMIDNPQPVSATAGPSVCEGNTTTVTVVKSTGQTTARLYTAASGGTALASTSNSGNTYTFTTPTLSAGTTTFYASTQTGSQENVGRPAPTGTSTIATSNYGLVFNATAAFTLTSVQVYPTAAGNLTVQVQNSAGTLIPGLTATVALAAGSGTVPQTVPLNFAVPAGTDLRLIATASPTMVREAAVGGFPYTSPSGTVSITSGYISGTSTTYYYFYNWQIGAQCEGSRVAVPVNATAAPAFSVTPSTTQPICAGSSVNVTASADAFYNSFVYTASPSGSSAGISQPSTSSANATLTPTVTTTYTVTASSSTGGAGSCQAIRTFTVTVNTPVVGTLSPTATTLCQGGTQVLTLSEGGGGTIQWQRSTTSATTGFADISGASGLTYTAMPGTTTTYYRAVVSCGNVASTVTSAVATITVTNPQPASTNAPLSVCSGSTGTLTVTGTTGQSFQFFDSPTSTTPLTSTVGGTASAPTASFTTPAITAPATYYVETNGNNAATVGKPIYTGLTGNTGVNTGLLLDVTTATTLKSVTVYSVVAAGSITIQLQDNTGTPLGGTAGASNTVTVTVNGGTAGNPVATVVPLNFPLPVGTNYRLLRTNTYSLVRESASGYTFPYTSSDNSVTITNSVLATGAASSGFYYYFYDLQLASNCTGARTPLQVNVTAPTTLSGTQSVGGSTYCDVNVTGNITLTGDLTINGTLTVANGATLNTNCNYVLGTGNVVVAAGGTLAVCQANGIRATASGASTAIRNSGTRSFSPDANYIYNGTVAQTTGDGLPTTVRSLTVNNAAGVTQTQGLSVTQLLTLTNGNLSTSGQPLTLLSSSAGTAVVVNTNGVVTGTATVQRWIDPSLNPGLGYRHYAAPVTGSTVADLQTSGFTPVLNPAYNTAAQPNYVRPFPTVYAYDEARLSTATNSLSDFDKGWLSPSAATDPLTVTKGYTVNIGANQLVDFNGTLNSGTIVATGLTRGPQADAGWQLLGNPYPSPINWNALAAADFTNLDQSVYVYSSTGRYTGQYTAFVNGVGGTQDIATAQGFFVRTTLPGTGSLRLSNAIRTTTYGPTPTFRRGTADQRPLLQLDLSSSAGTDPLYVYFEQGATAGQDAAFDAVKLPNTTGLNLSAVAGAHNLAIDGLPLLGTQAVVVPLFLGSPAAGSYTLTAAQLANFAPGTVVELRDALTGSITVLQPQASYRCTLPAGTIGGRFTLVFQPSTTALASQASLDAALVSLYPNPAHGRFVLQLPPVAGASQVQATLINALGQVVAKRTLPLSASTGARSEFSTAELAPGVYSLLVKAGPLTVTKRVVVE